MELDLISVTIKMKFMYYCFEVVGGHIRSGYLLLIFFFSFFYCGNQFARASLIGESLMNFKISLIVTEQPNFFVFLLYTCVIVKIWILALLVR